VCVCVCVCVSSPPPRLLAAQIVPQLVSLVDAEHAFYTVARRHDTDCREKIDVRPVFFHSVGKTRDSSYVTYKPFLELMGRIALVGFNKPFLTESHPENAQKVSALFHWISSSGHMNAIEQAEWQRGLSRHGRRMSVRQKEGNPEPRRRPSRSPRRFSSSPRRASMPTPVGGTVLAQDGAGGAGGAAAQGQKGASGDDVGSDTSGPLRSVLLSTNDGVPAPPPLDEQVGCAALLFSVLRFRFWLLGVVDAALVGEAMKCC